MTDTSSTKRRLALIESQLRTLATRQEHLGERSMSKRLLTLADQLTNITAPGQATAERDALAAKVARVEAVLAAPTMTEIKPSGEKIRHFRESDLRAALDASETP